jgi:hypothetical protein
MANKAAETVDVCQAVPYTLPRACYLVAALILVASSLFALRYGISRRLDLHAPLARMLRQQFENPAPALDAKRPRFQPAWKPDPEQEATGDEPEEQPGGEAEHPRADNSTGSANRVEAASKPEGSSKKESGQQASSQDQPAGDEEAQAENRQSGASGDGDTSARQGNGKEDRDREAARQDANGSGQKSSLMSKVKDAVQNLLSRVKPQTGSAGARQQAAIDQNRQGKQQQGGGAQQGAKDGRQNSGGQQGDSPEDQGGQQAQNSQDPQGKGTGKSDSQQASKQPGSGIGSQDGAKDVRQAEQLAAMGKISEIIGKRSANIIGEATVEVESGNQQLQTPYAQRRALHSEGGTEISRDEVPVALQAYVQQYFEQVRKQSPPKK